MVALMLSLDSEPNRIDIAGKMVPCNKNEKSMPASGWVLRSVPGSSVSPKGAQRFGGNV